MNDKTVESIELDYSVPASGAAGLFRASSALPSRQLLTVGEQIFDLEAVLKTRKGAPRKARLLIETLNGTTSPVFADTHLTKVLERLVQYVLFWDGDIEFSATDVHLQETLAKSSKDYDAVCLFSGGVDSTSGLLNATIKYDRVAALFCAHRNQSHAINLVRSLEESVLSAIGIEFFEMPVSPILKQGYAEMRGFLYILAAGALAHHVGASKVLVTECGPTMYQLRFAAADSTTMTTHPFVVARAQEVIRAISPNEIVIDTPFADCTKAEVMALCPDPTILPYTHSCVSQRLKVQDGTCYGCVVRRLAAAANEFSDAEYARDPITDDKANQGNFLSLLDFSALLLVAPDRLAPHQRDFLDAHDKWDLFERFALDNFAGLYNLHRKGARLAPASAALLKEVIKVLGDSSLEERLKALSVLQERATTRPDVRCAYYSKET